VLRRNCCYYACEIVTSESGLKVSRATNSATMCNEFGDRFSAAS
jgi:hypothetical protein